MLYAKKKLPIFSSVMKYKQEQNSNKTKSFFICSFGQCRDTETDNVAQLSRLTKN